jgi:hypothetical protein
LSLDDRFRSLMFFGAATLILSGGVAVAALRYPNGYDWVYVVISRLGSSTHNPAGGPWLSASLLAASCLLWPVTGFLDRGRSAAHARSRVAVPALRLGLLGAAVLALEGLSSFNLSGVARKGHEVVALLTFFGLYGGIVGFYLERIRRRASSVWPPLLVLLPLCAVAATQLLLYLDQRDLGWVDTGWREMGIPFWLSFAFWQWSAVGLLALGLGYLLYQPAATGEPNGGRRWLAGR